MTCGEAGTASGTGEGQPHRVCGIVFATLMGAVAALHLYWALGGMWGLAVASAGALGTGEGLSASVRAATAGFVLALLAAAGLALMRIGVLRDVMPSRVTVVGCWVVAVVMLAVAIGNFADGDLWGLLFRGPFSLLLFILALAVALPGRGSARNGGS